VNEPETTSDAGDSDFSDSGTMAANSALVSLEESKMEDPNYAAAVKAIADNHALIHEVAAASNPPQIVDNVKHMGWFRDAVAEEIEMRGGPSCLTPPTNEQLHQTISNAFAFASGEDAEEPVDDPLLADDDEPKDLETRLDDALSADDGYHDCLDCEGHFADEDCHAVDKGFVCQGCFEKRVIPAAVEDDEAQLLKELAVMDANPVGAEPGGPDDTHGLSQRQLLELSFEGAPEDVLDSSDPRDKQIGELSREVISLREQLAQKAKEVEDGESLYSQLQTKAAGLNHKIANDAAMLTGLDQEVSELRADLRKVKKAYGALKTLVTKAATYIAKAAPRTPSAKRAAFLKLADEMATAVADKLAKKTTTKKR
jgi:hypothetical protein